MTNVIALAKEALAKLDAFAEMERSLNAAFGDDRGAYYKGNVKGDLRVLATAVIEAFSPR